MESGLIVSTNEKKMSLMDKLGILSDAAKYDVSCSSSGVGRRGDKWRIPEGSLFLAGFVGGSVGAYLGMKLCHHKTKKWYFVYGLPVFMFFHAIFLVLWFISRLLPR